MSTFETEFIANAWPDLQSTFGIAATYKAGGAGTGSSVTGIWAPESESYQYMEDGVTLISSGVFMISTDEVANPTVEDTFTIGSAVYAVQNVAGGDPLFEITLRIISQEQANFASGRIER